MAMLLIWIRNGFNTKIKVVPIRPTGFADVIVTLHVVSLESFTSKGFHKSSAIIRQKSPIFVMI